MDLDIFSTTSRKQDDGVAESPPVIHVVRTFSKDAAAASITPPPPLPAPAASAVPAPPSIPLIPDVPSPVAPTPKSAWSSAPNVNTAPPPPPVPPQAPPTAALTPLAVPPPPSIPTPVSNTSTKNEILERLRLKAEELKKSQSLAVDSLLFSAEGKNELQRDFAPYLPKKETSPTKGAAPIGASPLHTYQLDFAGRIRDKKASPFTILAAEQDSRRAKEEVVVDSKRRKIWYASGAGLVVLALAGLFTAYYFLSGTALMSFGNVPSLIFADDQERIEGDAPALRNAIVNSNADEKLAEGAVRVLFAASSTTTPDGVVTSLVSGGALFAALQLPAPGILTRNIDPESTLGVINIDGETRAFFILRVSSYTTTFGGMLEWEKTMAKDLSVFYPPFPATPEPVVQMASTTTSTSTPPLPKPAPKPVLAPTFVDGTVANHSVRLLVDNERRTLMLYGYRDKTTLIIAGSEAAFTEIVRRLAATRQQ